MTRGLAPAALLLTCVLTVFAQDPAIEEAMDKLAKTFVDGFNAADAAALVIGYAEDADAVGFDGIVWKGRAKIQEAFAGTLETYKGSSIQFQRTSLHVVSPDVVVMDGSWEVSGGTVEQGAPTKGFLTFVVSKEGDSWQVVSLRAKVPPPAS